MDEPAPSAEILARLRQGEPQAAELLFVRCARRRAHVADQWQRGWPRRIEEYLQRFAELGSVDTLPPDLMKGGARRVGSPRGGRLVGRSFLTLGQPGERAPAWQALDQELPSGTTSPPE